MGRSNPIRINTDWFFLEMETVSISFELFPPKTEKGRENLRQTVRSLGVFNPDFFSVTFGAGGSTRDHTRETVLEIQQQSTFNATPHLSCIGSTHENALELLRCYKDAGIHQIVILRGDRPSGILDIGEFHHANELVSFIREQTGDHFHIQVAAYPEMHPESKSSAKDLDNFKRKVNAGANSAITQYFYNMHAYLDFVDRCHSTGIDIPIFPGIMPITNYERLAQFSSICGAEIPRWLHNRLQDFGDDTDSIRAFGIDFVSQLCEDLLRQGAPGIHFYTLNQAQASTEIMKRINL